MTTATNDVADLLDQISRTFIRFAGDLWDAGWQRFTNDVISWDEYEEIKAQSGALIRRAVEIVSSASEIRLRQAAGSIAGLKEVTVRLTEAKKRIEKAQNLVEAALTAVAAVTLVVTAVAAPTPGSIGAAVHGMADLVAATAAAS